MKLRVINELKWDGLRHAPGSVLRNVPITTGRRLVLAGNAEVLPDAPELVEVSAPGDDQVEAAVPFSEWNKGSLAALAKELGLAVPSRSTRAELAELVEAEVARRAEAEAGADAGIGDQPPGDGEGSGDQPTGVENGNAGDTAVAGDEAGGTPTPAGDVGGQA